MNILKAIVKEKKKEIEMKKKKIPIESFKSRCKKNKKSFKLVLKKNKTPTIAELKIASPSSGNFKKKVDVKEIIEAYNRHASAISVVTDEKFFKGSIKLLKKIVKYSDLPILRKDFVIDEYQVFESRFFGANALLLIASIVSKKKLEELKNLCESLKMDVVVEVNTKTDLDKALGVGAKIILINNRNLNNFKVDIKKTQKVLQLIPKDNRKKIKIISASGFDKRKDIETLNGKVEGFLIGTSLMKAKNIESKFKELKGEPLIKICGITSKKDALNAISLGADFLGFNFCKESPRYILPKTAKKIINTIPQDIQTVGIFVNEKAQVVKNIKEKCGLEFVRFHGNESQKYCKNFENVIKAIRVKRPSDIKKTA